MSTVFDQRLLWVYQGGDSVQETDVAALAGNISSATPNVAGLLLKTSHGAEWQGLRDSRPRLAIKGPGAIRRWVQTLGKSGLETHLWCVLRGADVRAETRLVTQACNVPGVRSMLLSFEAEPGASYFSGGSAATARELITRIRAGIAPDFHLGLNLDARGNHPASIRLRQWLPFVQSLHPMIFHYEFGGGRRGAGVLAGPGLRHAGALRPAAHPHAADLSAARARAGGAGPARRGRRLAQGRQRPEHLSLRRRLLHRADSGRRAQHQPAGRRVEADWQAVPERRVFRVSGTRLRARRLPRRNSPMLAYVTRGTVVEVSGNSRTEAEGYVWWRSAQGWLPQGRSDHRHTLMIEITPAMPPQGLALMATRERPVLDHEAPQTPLKRFRVIARGLGVRSRPLQQREFLRETRLQRGDELLVEADAWTEQDGFRWWFHGAGWSAELAPGSGLRFLEDLTPEVTRMRAARPQLAQFSAQSNGSRALLDPGGGAAEESPPDDEAAELLPKRFRVLVPRLSIRSHPALAGSANETRLLEGDEIEVSADAWVEQDGYVWWLHGPGWSVERSLNDRQRFLGDLTPEIGRSAGGARGRPATYPGAPPHRDERNRWQVLALTLPVVDAPGAAAVRSGRLQQGDVLLVADDPERLVEADDYLWLRHGQGWSAVRRLDGRKDFLLNLDALPLLGSLLQRFPVTLKR